MNEEITAYPDGDLAQVMRGAVALVTCVVQTASESDPDFQTRFLKRLTEAYYLVRDKDGPTHLREMEMLSWTRELLTGSAWSAGQGKPFLDGEGK